MHLTSLGMWQNLLVMDTLGPVILSIREGCSLFWRKALLDNLHHSLSIIQRLFPLREVPLYRYMQMDIYVSSGSASI